MNIVLTCIIQTHNILNTQGIYKSDSILFTIKRILFPLRTLNSIIFERETSLHFEII